MPRASCNRPRCVATALLLYGGINLAAQQTIGSVATQDASVSGALEVTGARAVLTGASTVTARDHAADVALSRGGTVRICQTSGVKLSSGKVSAIATQTNPPLMVALDRGAVEVKMLAIASDILLTPDLRFAVSQTGPLDLRVRVTPNGDTCVEQREPNAPILILSDAFSESTYQIHGGQHVLFEHGSLREVVDHETSPCGCPEPPRSVSLAEAVLGGPASSAEKEHPFPAAESAGLAPTSEIPQVPAGAIHTQVAATLGYTGAEPAAPAAPVLTAAPVTKQDETPHGFGHAVKHFFKRLFGG